MAGWHSLAGYLYHRSDGTLSYLKSRKRLWYVFEESRCQLLYYKSQEDAQGRPPMGFIDIKRAGIRLSSEESNQFVIHSEGKNYVLAADNHEAMMIWLLALQAKRDAFNSRVSNIPEQQKQQAAEHDEQSLPNDEEIQAIIRKAKNAEQSGDLMRSRSLRRTRNDQPRRLALLRRLGKTVDFGDNMPSETLPIGRVERRLSLSSEELCHEVEPLTDFHVDFKHTSSSSALTNNTSDELSNDEDALKPTMSPKRKTKILRKMNSDFFDHDILPLEYDRPGSLSRNSASSDSALGKSESETSSKVSDMEREMMDTKCELMKVLNREMSLKDLLQERDHTIMILDEKLTHLQEMHKRRENRNLSPDRYTSEVQKKLEEQIRILQNQNRFLNEEVLKLSRMWQQEQVKVLKQQEKARELIGQIDKFKKDYVFLLQSAIRIPAGDTQEGMEVCLYGGNVHKLRVQHLLDEARQINPMLPTYEGLAKSGAHVDSYGFKHRYHSEGLILHYICRQLNHHYSTQLMSYEKHQLQWKEFLRRNKHSFQKTKELKGLVRAGIPPQFRGDVWKQFIHFQVMDIKEQKGAHYYSNLCSLVPDSQWASHYRKQIALDLLRTMPNNIHFCDQSSDKVTKLREVLQAFCIHNPALGYCQGMNFIVGMSLLFMEAEDAFWFLVAVTEKFFMVNYFDQNLIGAQADQEVLKEIVSEKLPHLYSHLQIMDIDLCTVTLNWFLAIFFDSVPFETLLRVWDCFLLEGPKVLFRFSIAILKMHEDLILSKHDTISIMRHLKAAAKLAFDMEGLIKIAFQNLKPFPRRQNISSKQACYIKALKEKLRKKEQERREFAEKEQMLLQLECGINSAMVIECAAVYDEEKVWICVGQQNFAKILKVNCEENIMYDLNIQFDARIMCIKRLSNDTMLLGTLSSHLYAYNARTKEELWKVRLNDTILSICYQDEMGRLRVFAALADSTIAVLEDVGHCSPSIDIFYIPVGHAPVTCVILLGDLLWCACANNVVIFNSSTLDQIDQFQVSSNSLDYISTLSPGNLGVWIAIRGSSLIELWDPLTLTCKLIYDVKENKYPCSQREEDSLFNKSRVTSLLPQNNSVWVGTGDGNLIIYEVVTRRSNKSSPCTSHSTSPSRIIPQSNTQLHQIEKRIQELYDNQNRKTAINSMNVVDSSPKRRLTCIMQSCDSVDSTDTVIEVPVTPKSLDLLVDKQDSKIDPVMVVNQWIKECDLSSNEWQPSDINLSSNNKVGKDSDLLEKEVSSNLTAKSPIKDSEISQDIIANLENKTMLEQVAPQQKLNDSLELKIKQSECKKNEKHIESKKNNIINKNKETKDRLLLKDMVKLSDAKAEHETEENCSVVETDDGLSAAEDIDQTSRQSTTTTDSDRNKSCSLSITSSLTSDGFEYDDVFVPYKEEEKDQSEGSAEISKNSLAAKHADILLHNLQKNLIDNKRKKTLAKANETITVQNAKKEVTKDEFKDIKDKPESQQFLKETKSVPVEPLSPTININSECIDGEESLVPKPLTSCQVSAFLQDSQKNSSKSSVNWSSTEDISHMDYDSFQDSSSRKDYLSLEHIHQWQGSDTTSNLSMISSSEVPYVYDLIVQEKIKISDKPIKCLLFTRCSGEPTIISCAGCYGDDEAVLKWTKEPYEKLWINDPVVEVCPLTNTVKPSQYVRSRLPRTSSIKSIDSIESRSRMQSTSSIKSSGSSHSTGTVVDSGMI